MLSKRMEESKLEVQESTDYVFASLIANPVSFDSKSNFGEENQNNVA